jgi:hypothetical protein
MYGIDMNQRQYQIAATMENAFAYNPADNDLYAFGPDITHLSTDSNTLHFLKNTAIPVVYAENGFNARVAGNYK